MAILRGNKNKQTKGGDKMNKAFYIFNRLAKEGVSYENIKKHCDWAKKNIKTKELQEYTDFLIDEYKKDKTA